MASRAAVSPLLSPALLREAGIDSLRKLSPRWQLRNPVIFVVYAGAALTTLVWLLALAGLRDADPGFTLAVAAWLWLTVLFANFAEAVAEGRGRAQAASLRQSRQALRARRLRSEEPQAAAEEVAAEALRKGDLVRVEAGETIPLDGEVIAGAASVDESAVTGESAPVVRESGGDRSAVTGGTRVISDWLLIRVTSDPGQGFLDRMIALVEGAVRAKTPNEIALAVLLAALTLVFLVVTVSMLPIALFGTGSGISMAVLAALLVCLAPTTIGALLSAIGIAGMNRLSRANVIALSGRAVEAAGDVDVLMLDKTGTITLGNRQATELLAVRGVAAATLADASQLASLADETPEGRSIVVLAKRSHGIRGRDLARLGAHFVPFSARTRMSGVDLDGRSIRKGSADAIEAFVRERGGTLPAEVVGQVAQVAREGGTPLVVCEGARVLGTIALRDVIKGGLRERFAELRRMGIRTVMITGDNPMTAAAIAAEAGLDDFLAEATPEAKLALIQSYQARGHLVAMTGDGTNDAPALAQADVAVAMNTGTQAAKEAGNMVDLDSNPSKLLDIIQIGKQILITRGALTTFSVANDIAKYFAIIPAAFAASYPELGALNLMGLSSPESAVLAAVIFNALAIVALIPIAVRGVAYRALPANRLLRRNLLIYGVGGLLAPFLGIKLVDLLLQALGWV